MARQRLEAEFLEAFEAEFGIAPESPPVPVEVIEAAIANLAEWAHP